MISFGDMLGRYKVTADPQRSERGVELVLVLVALLLLLQLAYGGLRLLWLSSPAPIYPAEDSLALASVASPALLAPEVTSDVLSRPVFWASRRPLQAVEVAVSTKPEKKAPPAKRLKDVKLVGVFGAGESAGIIVLHKGKRKRLLVGQDIDGWTLQSVESREATMSSQGVTEQLALSRSVVQVEQSAGGARPQPAPGAAPAARQEEDSLSFGGG